MKIRAAPLNLHVQRALWLHSENVQHRGWTVPDYAKTCISYNRMDSSDYARRDQPELTLPLANPFEVVFVAGEHGPFP